jgi:hypothetical protein
MINSRNMLTAHPVIQRGFTELNRRFQEENRAKNLGFTNIGVSSVYRCHAYQEHLFSQGRSRSGAIVTNARGGYSIHNYRLAFDVFQNTRGREWENGFFALLGRIWVEMGGVWGGNWVNFVDRPHFEFTAGLTVSQLRNGHVLADDVEMPWESGKDWKQPVNEDNNEYYNAYDDEVIEMRYNTIDELPEWAIPTIEKLIKRGLLLGTELGFDLSSDMLRMFIINDRAGLYDD